MPVSAPVELSIVIPVYNEPDNIPLVITALSQNVPGSYEILAVYDFDEDTTLPVLRQLAREHPQLRLVKNGVARGPSGALRAGFAEASAPLILVTMADLCDDLTQVPHLLKLAKSGAHVVTPSRYCAGGKQHLKESLKVKAPRTAGWLIHVIAGLPTHDPTNSFKLYSSELLRNVRLRSTVSFSVTLEIVAKAHCLGYRIVEVPTVWRDRQHGKTNFKLGRSLFAYFPWLCVALLRGRFFRLPSAWLRAWFAADPQSSISVIPSRP